MKFLIIGMGSVGRRHAKILMEYFEGHEYYALRSAHWKQTDKHFPSPRLTAGWYVDWSKYIKYLYSWAEVDKIKPDVALICNPTHKHIATALECAKRDMHLFIEKPIDCRTEDLFLLLGIVEQRGLSSYVAYPLRHHPTILNLIPYRPIFMEGNHTLYCHTNKEAWRDYKTYSERRDTGGGALLELSHEIDIAQHLFGLVTNISGLLGGYGLNTEDAESMALLRLNHLDGSVSALSLATCIDNQGLRMIDYNEIPMSDTAKDEMFHNQMNYFVQNIGNLRMANNLFEAAPLFEKIIEFREAEYASACHYMR
jgi:predicted dehydrogenase